jgi:hypothetical protein
MSPWYGPATVTRDLGENKYIISDDSLESALIPEEERPIPEIPTIEPRNQEMDVEEPSAMHQRSATMKILSIQEPARNPDKNNSNQELSSKVKPRTESNSTNSQQTSQLRLIRSAFILIS